MMTDKEFEDEAVIQVLAALVARENFHAVPPNDMRNNPADYAKKAYLYASVLVEERKKRPGQAPPSPSSYSLANKPKPKP